MKKILKYFLFIIYLLDFGSQIEAKPVPPGSGEGDVPANILILIDSSASMKRRINNRDSVAGVTEAVYDSGGNIIANQVRTLGLVKFSSSGSRDRDYNNERAKYTGNVTHSCLATFTPASTAGAYTTEIRNTTARHSNNAVSATGVTTDDTTLTNENLIFFRSKDAHLINAGAVVGISEDGQNCRFFLEMGFRVMTFDIISIGGEHIIFASGQEFGGRNGIFRTFNIDAAELGPLQNHGTGATSGRIMTRTERSTVDSTASWYYLPQGDIYGYELESTGNNYQIAGGTRRYQDVWRRANLDTQLAPASAIDISPDDDDIMYVVSHRRHVLQKLELTTNTTYTVLARAGTGRRSRAMNVEASGSLTANRVRLNRPFGVTVTSSRILVTSAASATIDEFNEDLFNSTNRDTAWLQQMGGGRLTRWTGVKKAMAAILSDSTLTTGAHFGYGHWNAGEHGGNRDAAQGGRRCHRGHDTCNYWTSWTDGINPDTLLPSHSYGRSTQCNRDHCLDVAISGEGYRRILGELMPRGLAWGTDAKAFSQMAKAYFEIGGDDHPYDATSECQLNYVIVIGDGEMMNVDEAKTDIEDLRSMENPVKTIFVAYGGGISTRGLGKFDELAVSGSCAGGIEGDDNGCEATIIADTPAALKSEITARIRQILAERLSFTAPSITATVQEGGSLYQAQFEYEQYGEWKGTILRKTLRPDGSVNHVITDSGPNWSAAVEVWKQAGPAGTDDERNIWTAMGVDAPYLGNWDNFHEDNIVQVSDLFAELEYSVPDYHNTTSHCTTVGADGSHDDEIGLINFVRGVDYFDYDGDCNILGETGIDEVRDHVLGDIYHSQLIEIGAPDASTTFSSTNDESYFRSKNNYQGFAAKLANRPSIVYAGSNSGLLHAFSAGGDLVFNADGSIDHTATGTDTVRGGTELWAFMPPFIAALLPTIISPALDGTVDASKSIVGGAEDAGGSNSIFGVDGSPVVHDVFIQGYDGSDGGNYESSKSWHTLLFIPYGRGGAGFSVLDVTYPLIEDGQGPVHMFSVYNDAINSQVLIADRDGTIIRRPYNQTSVSIGDSLEADIADTNFAEAIDADGGSDTDVSTAQDAIAVCQRNADADAATPSFTGPFYTDGTASCYIGTSFTFEMGEMEDLKADGKTIPKSSLRVTERIGGTMQVVDFDRAEYVDGQVILYFTTDRVYNPRGPGTVTISGEDKVIPEGNEFNISTSCVANRGIDEKFDYSQLGETWSAPRIFRIPSWESGLSGDMANDKYVAAFGAGMGNISLCAGNAFFIVDLEAGLDNLPYNPGEIYAAEINSGPITIVDTDPGGIFTTDGLVETVNGSDIGNALAASPVIITPETAFNIPWRGAMVYINDMEGKITKINLTNSDEYGARMFEQTTLFRLDASTSNARHSFFQMDAGVGLDTNDFWLFGGTGNFNDIGGATATMDNILYGVKDPHYPYFKSLNEVEIPLESEGGEFINLAHLGANNAKGIEDAAVCSNVTGDNEGIKCPTSEQLAWVIHLGEVDGISPTQTDGSGNIVTQNTFRKLSAAPTIFKGKVYYPIYEPPGGASKCNIGNAFICVADDECGTNASHLLTKGEAPDGKKCKFVREGILSELVIFGDKLFANVAGPKEDARTLYSVLAATGDVSKSRGSWRETGF